MIVTVLKNNYELQGKDYHISKVIAGIRNPSEDTLNTLNRVRQTENKDEKNKIKMFLPAFFPSGTFRENKYIANMYQHSGIIHLDIDNVQLSKRIRNNIDTKHVVFMFTSPSFGLKVGFKVNPVPKDNSEHIWGWEILNQTYAAGKSDKGAKSWNKQCNASSDPEAYYNGDCTPFLIPPMPPPTVYSGAPIKVKGLKAAFELAEDIIKKQGHSFTPGERNNYIFNLCSILNKMGIDIQTADNLLAKRFGGTKFPLKELNDTLVGVYKRHRDTHGSMKIEQETNIKYTRRNKFSI
jgi:hypothetical protein